MALFDASVRRLTAGKGSKARSIPSLAVTPEKKPAIRNGWQSVRVPADAPTVPSADALSEELERESRRYARSLD